MKIKSMSILGLGLFLGMGVANAEDSTSRVIEVPAQMNAVFVPKGFDSNDNSLVVVAGAYPNSCYKMGPTQVSVDKQTRTVSIDVKAYYTTDVYCLMLYIPFTQAINVGVLQAGEYKIVINRKDTEKLPIALATRDQPDDYVYATVSNLSRLSQNRFQLQGYLPNSCSQISEVRVLEEAGNVIAVLPIISFAEGCEPNHNPEELAFTTEFQVPSHLSGHKLMHVRSLNGSSMNQVFSF